MTTFSVSGRSLLRDADSAGADHPAAGFASAVALFALGRMSRANEIVSMLTAGVSLPRVLLPLIGIGLLTVAASMALNYSLAPHAELARKTFLSEAQARPARNIQGQVFRNRTRPADLVYPELSPRRQHIQQRAGAATGRERQYRHELRGRSCLLPA